MAYEATTTTTTAAEVMGHGARCTVHGGRLDFVFVVWVTVEYHIKKRTKFS